MIIHTAQAAQMKGIIKPKRMKKTLSATVTEGDKSA